MLIVFKIFIEGKSKKNCPSDEKNVSLSEAIQEVTLSLRQLKNTRTFKTVNKEVKFNVRNCQKTIAEMYVDSSTYVKLLKYFVEHKDWCNVFGFMTINERIIWLQILN